MNRARVTAVIDCAGLGACAASAGAQDRTTPPVPPTATTSAEPPEAPLTLRIAEARQPFDQGAVYFERENCDAASAEFQRAFDLLEGTPRQYTVLFNIGQTQEPCSSMTPRRLST